MKSIILLSGLVGAGKSTVARELVAGLAEPAVYIEGDTFWSFFTGAARQVNAKNFKTIMISMTVAAVPYVLAGYDVIVDFSIPPWFLPTARAVASMRNVPLDYIVLRPSEAICAVRAASRTEGVIADYAPYSKLYSSFDDAERYTIQDDRSDASELATRIRDGLKAGKFRVS